ERAAGDLRRGVAVVVRSARAGESKIAVAAETVSSNTLRILEKRFGAPSFVVTHDRAATLKIPLYTPDVVLIPQKKEFTADDLGALANPAADLDFPLKGPFEASRETPPEAAAASVKLAKLAGLLPATAIFPLGTESGSGLSEVLASDIAAFEDSAAASLELV